MTMNLDFVTYEGDDQCNPVYEFSSGILVAVSVSKDGKQNNPDDRVYGYFCEAAAYTIAGTKKFTKIEITCADAGISRSYYHCDIGDYDCSGCDEYAFLQTVEEDWKDWMTPSVGKCYGEIDTNRVPNGLSSSKFVGDYEDFDTWYAFYMNNSCIGDYDY